jgi:hypothetical protein
MQMHPGLVLQYLNGFAPQIPYGNALLMVPGLVPPFFFGFPLHAPLGLVLQVIRGLVLQPLLVPPVAQPVQHAVLEQELLARAAEEAAARRAAEEIVARRAAEEAVVRRAAEEAAARRTAEEIVARRAAEEAAARRAAEEIVARRAAEEAAARREANSRLSVADEDGFQTIRPKPNARQQAAHNHSAVGVTHTVKKECRWTLGEFTEGKSKNCFNPECPDKHPEGYVPGPQRRCRKAERCTMDGCNHAHPGDRFWAHVQW